MVNNFKRIGIRVKFDLTHYRCPFYGNIFVRTTD